MFRKYRKKTYLDYASSTPLDQEVRKLLHKSDSFFGNPSSIHHSGQQSRSLIENSRKEISKLINAHPDEIIFTASGTESDALGIFGVLYDFVFNLKQGVSKVPHIITSSVEHPAVLNNCALLEKRGLAEVTYIDIDEGGFVNIKAIKDSLKENTILVSIMYANNEIGTVQDIEGIARAIRHFKKSKNIDDPMKNYPLFHTDACQATNYLFMENIEKLGVDLMSINSSKIYGPKGIGMLYKKRSVNLLPIYSGGDQEFGLRSGTESVSLIVAFHKALSKTFKLKQSEVDRLVNLRDYAISKLLSLNSKNKFQIILNGDKVKRLPNNINISVVGFESELLVIELDAMGIEVSSKSACKSSSHEESYVIEALRKSQNLNTDAIDGSIRISLGRATKKKDINKLVSSMSAIFLKYNKWK